MLCLVIGGSGSGKSEYAEKRCMELCDVGKRKRFPAETGMIDQGKTTNKKCGEVHNKVLYIATMDSTDAESDARILRHRQRRAGKGFETLECQTHLENAEIPVDATVLLECMSNLVANEMFSPEGRWIDVRKNSSLKEGKVASLTNITPIGQILKNDENIPEPETVIPFGHGKTENSLECDMLSLIMQGIRHLCDRAKHTVVVTNQVFSDGISYDAETERYQRILANVNAEIAALADEVVEVVHGIPIRLE